MLTNLVPLFIAFVLLSFIQFLGFWLYLRFSEVIETPETEKAKKQIGIAWLVLVTFVGAIVISGIKSVEHFGGGLNRAIGLAPLAIGAIASLMLFRARWKRFHKRFNQK